MVLCGATKHDSRGLRLDLATRQGRAVVLAEHSDAITADFESLADINETSLFGRGCAKAREGSGGYDTAKTTKFKFGEDFEDEDVVSVEIVEGKLADVSACNDDLDAGCCDLGKDLENIILGGRKREREGVWRTFSICFSSPRVKLSISSAFLMRTVPFVSVCAISIGLVNTATLPFVICFTSPDMTMRIMNKNKEQNSAYLLVLGQTPYLAQPCSRPNCRP